jgi:hypothetical protein
MIPREERSATIAGRALHAYLHFVAQTTRFKPVIPGAKTVGAKP